MQISPQIILPSMQQQMPLSSIIFTINPSPQQFTQILAHPTISSISTLQHIISKSPIANIYNPFYHLLIERLCPYNMDQPPISLDYFPPQAGKPTLDAASGNPNDSFSDQHTTTSHPHNKLSKEQNTLRKRR